MKIIFLSLGAIFTLVFFLAGGFYIVKRAQLKTLILAEQKEKAQGKLIALSQGTTHYSLAGKPSAKPTIVLVHGFSTPSFVWKGIVPDLVGAGYQVLSYDLYGRGWSDRPNIKYDAQLYHTQLKELLRALGLGKNIIVVGYSMGGAIVTYYAAREPVSGVGLIAPAGLDIRADGAGPFLLPVIGDWIMAVRGREFMLETMAQPANQGKAIPNIVELYKTQMEYDGYLTALLSTLRHFPLGGMEEEYKKMGQKKIPTLTIFGKRDSVVPVANMKRIDKLVPHGKKAIHDRATHAITYSEPQFVSAALLKFFKTF